MRVNPLLPMATGMIFRAVFQTRTYGNVQQFTQDFMGTGPSAAPAADINVCVITLANRYAVAGPAVYSDVTTLESVTGICLTDNTVISSTSLLGLGTVGTVVAPPYNMTVAVVNTKRTSIRGQHGRGRLYFGPLPNSFLLADEDFITPVAVGAYATLYAALSLPMPVGGVTYDPCVSSRPVPPATLVTRAALITSSTVQQLCGTVRRRREGRGI